MPKIKTVGRRSRPGKKLSLKPTAKKATKPAKDKLRVAAVQMKFASSI